MSYLGWGLPLMQKNHRDEKIVRQNHTPIILLQSQMQSQDRSLRKIRTGKIFRPRVPTETASPPGPVHPCAPCLPPHGEPPPRPPVSRDHTIPNPGPPRAPVYLFFWNRAQYGPGFRSSNPISGRKLLEDLHNQGIRRWWTVGGPPFSVDKTGAPPDFSVEETGLSDGGGSPKTGLPFIWACHSPIRTEIGRWNATIKVLFPPCKSVRLP